MEKLASRHAITELMSWISLMENIMAEDQDKISGAVGSEVVQNFLQKYKVASFSICLGFISFKTLLHNSRDTFPNFFQLVTLVVQSCSHVHCTTQHIF